MQFSIWHGHFYHHLNSKIIHLTPMENEKFPWELGVKRKIEGFKITYSN